MITRMKTLICDGQGGTRCASGSHEHFARSTEYKAISDWCHKNGWKLRRAIGGRWTHHCEACEIKRMGLPADYLVRIAS